MANFKGNKISKLLHHLHIATVCIFIHDIILTLFFCLHACSEHEILREEIKSLQAVRSKLQQKIQDLEDELKKVKEDAEQSKATKVCMNLEQFFFPIKGLKKCQ